MKALSILVIGGALGWLTGLSTSPVVAAVIASCLALGIQLVSMKRPGNSPDSHESPFVSAALFFLGIAISAPIGIYCRENGVFAGEIFDPNTHEFLCNPNISKNLVESEIKFWAKVTGNKYTDIATGYFSLYSKACGNVGTEKEQYTRKQRAGYPAGLYSQSSDTCESLMRQSDENIRAQMFRSGKPFLAIAELEMSPLQYKKTVEAICERK